MPIKKRKKGNLIIVKVFNGYKNYSPPGVAFAKVVNQPW
ncbi:hypothetical protein M23134_01928 [Microscilla marina ATCC 23134]|uniref:Uncharacterized protein n=1 Tax=Microscilla marina ATCC 23134 TaxID=313606 RepID=A1ZC96_MICM2|nr:hypothetical protein M23134_01928 [Microscilla marina ATCC 23134]